MTDSTLKEDILAALKKERDRLNAIPSAEMTPELEDRLSNTVEFITLINRSSPGREATVEIRNYWVRPISL